METPNKRFLDIRNKNKLTQAEFADRLNIKKSQVNNIESGQQKLTTELAMKVAALFREDWVWIISGQHAKELIDDPEINEAITLLLKAKAGDIEAGKSLERYTFQVLADIYKKKSNQQE